MHKMGYPLVVRRILGLNLGQNNFPQKNKRKFVRIKHVWCVWGALNERHIIFHGNYRSVWRQIKLWIRAKPIYVFALMSQRPTLCEMIEWVAENSLHDSLMAICNMKMGIIAFIFFWVGIRNEKWHAERDTEIEEPPADGLTHDASLLFVRHKEKRWMGAPKNIADNVYPNRAVLSWRYLTYCFCNLPTLRSVAIFLFSFSRNEFETWFCLRQNCSAGNSIQWEIHNSCVSVRACVYWLLFPSKHSKTTNGGASADGRQKIQ